MITKIAVGRFDFRTLVHSHGWWMLAPFAWSEPRAVLARPLRLSGGDHVEVQVRVRAAGASSCVTISADRRLSPLDRQAVRDQVRRMLSLDEDLSAFYRACSADPMLGFVASLGAGRLLRAPSAFEDVVKTVCTTNCDWRNTLKMCASLCDLVGGHFPTPEELLCYSPSRLSARVPLGYRSRTLLEVAKLTVAGKLPLDVWAHAGRYDDVRAALQSIWGIGPYALNHMMVLLGDYAAIPVDCEVLKYLQATHFSGKNVTPAEAVSVYEKYGRFRFLAFKFGRMARKRDFARAAGRESSAGCPER